MVDSLLHYAGHDSWGISYTESKKLKSSDQKLRNQEFDS